MFRSGILEAFTHVHPATPHVLYLPAIAALVWWNALPWDRAALVALGGLFAWTFTEYTMHRFVFHFKPRSEFGRWFYFMIHGVHHDYPNDSRRLVMPPLVSLPLAALFFGLFRAALPAAWVPASFAAFLAGYLLYDTAHFAIHHWAPRRAFLKLLKRHHLRHHYVYGDKNYGVSSPMWDYVFGSVGRRPSPVKALDPAPPAE